MLGRCIQHKRVTLVLLPYSVTFEGEEVKRLDKRLSEKELPQFSRVDPVGSPIVVGLCDLAGPPPMHGCLILLR